MKKWSINRDNLSDGIIITRRVKGKYGDEGLYLSCSINSQHKDNIIYVSRYLRNQMVIHMNKTFENDNYFKFLKRKIKYFYKKIMLAI